MRLSFPDTLSMFVKPVSAPSAKVLEHGSNTTVQQVSRYPYFAFLSGSELGKVLQTWPEKHWGSIFWSVDIPLMFGFSTWMEWQQFHKHKKLTEMGLTFLELHVKSKLSELKNKSVISSHITLKPVTPSRVE